MIRDLLHKIGDIATNIPEVKVLKKYIHQTVSKGLKEVYPKLCIIPNRDKPGRNNVRLEPLNQ